MLFILLLIFTPQISALTGKQAAQYCHCDLTASFCDFDCCCDSDCTSNPSADCFYIKSNSYCPDATFFARLGSSYLTPQGCFYFNSTDTVLQEIALTSSQVKNIVNNKATVDRLATSQASTATGYQIGDTINIGGNPSFTFVDSSGACLTSAGTTTFQLKFGLNMRLSCSLSSSTIPQLYSTFSGQTIPQFSGDTTHAVTLPAFASTGITSVDLKIVIGSYGSAKARYIERAVVSTSSATSTKRTLNIWFIEPSELKDMGAAPSFFPQLPSDMFYPIYLMS